MKLKDCDMSDNTSIAKYSNIHVYTSNDWSNFFYSYNKIPLLIDVSGNLKVINLYIIKALSHGTMAPCF